MSGLRSSNSVTNTVVDTLRIRGVTEPGLLITSSSGAVSVGTAPMLTNLTVSGPSVLGSAVVLGPLTSNSVNALASLTTPNAFITNLDVSNATIANLDFTAASVNSLDISNATITNGSIGRLAVDVSASIANLSVNPSLTVVDSGQILTVAPFSLYSSAGSFNIGVGNVTDVFSVVDDGFTGYIRVGHGSGAKVYIAGAGAEGQIQMNTGSGGVLNLGSSTSTNAHAIVLSDNQVKINAPAGNPAITVTDIFVNIFTPGTSNPAISVDASGTTITLPLNVSSSTPRYYYSDSVAYPTSPWLQLYSLGQISLISDQIVYDNPPNYYYYNNFKSFIQNFSLIQVNLYFDAAGQNVNTGVATFKLRSDPSIKPPATKSFFINTSGFPPEPTQVSLSFIMQNGINYDNDTNTFIFYLNSFENNGAQRLLVGLDTKFNTFHWELIGLL